MVDYVAAFMFVLVVKAVKVQHHVVMIFFCYICSYSRLLYSDVYSVININIPPTFCLPCLVNQPYNFVHIEIW